MMAALTAFCKKSGKKVAILGQMNELGAFESEEHKKLASWVANQELTCYWVGRPFQPWVEKAFYFETVQEAIDFFSTQTLSKTHLLIKASRSLALETLIDVLH